MGALLLTTPVKGAEINGESDLALAMRAIGTSAAQLDRAAQSFGPALEAAKAQAAKALYWEDACKSTPECGGNRAQ